MNLNPEHGDGSVILVLLVCGFAFGRVEVGVVMFSEWKKMLNRVIGSLCGHWTNLFVKPKHGTISKGFKPETWTLSFDCCL